MVLLAAAEGAPGIR
jgi:hypothetical protein